MGLSNCVYNYIMINPVNFKLINANTGYIAAAVLQNAHIYTYFMVDGLQGTNYCQQNSTHTGTLHEMNF